MSARKWFAEFSPVTSNSGATGATGATPARAPKQSKGLADAKLLHQPETQGATGGAGHRVAPVAPVLHQGGSEGATEKVEQEQHVGGAVAPIGPRCTSNAEELDLRAAYEERAAILEYDGGFSREEAERKAREEIYGDNPLPETWPAFQERWQ